MSLRSSHVRELYHSIVLYGRLRDWQLFSNKVIGVNPLDDLDRWDGDGLIAHTLGKPEPLQRIRKQGIQLSTSVALGVISIFKASGWMMKPADA